MKLIEIVWPNKLRMAATLSFPKDSLGVDVMTLKITDRSDRDAHLAELFRHAQTHSASFWRLERQMDACRTGSMRALKKD